MVLIELLGFRFDLRVNEMNAGRRTHRICRSGVDSRGSDIGRVAVIGVVAVLICSPRTIWQKFENHHFKWHLQLVDETNRKSNHSNHLDRLRHRLRLRLRLRAGGIRGERGRTLCRSKSQ